MNHVYRYVMIGGALNGRIYQLPRDLGPEFRLPPSNVAIAAYHAKLKQWHDADQHMVYGSEKPTPPPDTVYRGLVYEVQTFIPDEGPDETIEIRYCVPEEWGKDPETVAKELIRYFMRMNTAVSDAVTNAGTITPEIVRLGKFVGIFHR